MCACKIWPPLARIGKTIHETIQEVHVLNFIKYLFNIVQFKHVYLAVDVSALAEARLMLKNLQEDVTYEVTVRTVTKDGLYGPESQQQTGIPVNRSMFINV